MPKFNPLSLLDKNRGVFGVNLGHLWHEPIKAAQWMNAILQGVQDGWVNPYVDKTFTLDEAERIAFRRKRKNIGKAVLNELKWTVNFKEEWFKYLTNKVEEKW